MLKKTLFFLIPIIIIIVLISYSDINNKSDELIFKINSKTFTHGDFLLWEYELDNKTIKITQDFVDGRAQMIWTDRNLNDLEKEKLVNFLKDFPLKNLQEKYINETYEGEIHNEYSIEIDGLKKDIYVYGTEQEDLTELVNLIGTFMEPPTLVPPEEYNSYTGVNKKEDVSDDTIMDDTNMNKKGMEEQMKSTALRVAWNSLTEEKKEMIGEENKQNASISKTDWKNVQEKIEEDEPPFVYLVTFERELKTPTGPIGIYVDPTEEKIVGYTTGI